MMMIATTIVRKMARRSSGVVGCGVEDDGIAEIEAGCCRGQGVVPTIRMLIAVWRRFILTEVRNCEVRIKKAIWRWR